MITDTPRGLTYVVQVKGQASAEDCVELETFVLMLRFFLTGSVVNASNLHIVGAFLLNVREFPFLHQYEIQHTTMAYTVSPN